MTLLSSLKTAVSNVSSKLKSTFLPSESVAAERRLKTFGSTSKAKAAAVITTTAAAAIAAPVLATSAAARTAVKTAAVSVAKKVAAKPVLSLKIGAAGVFGAGLLSQTSKPLKTLTKAPEATFDLGSAIGKSIEDRTVSPLLQYGKEHPIASGVIGAAAGYGLLKGAAGVVAASKVIGSEADKAQNIIYETAEGQLQTIPTTTTGSTPVPITPETQIIGKAAGTRSVSTYRRKAKAQPFINRINIQLINQSRLIKSVKYLN